MLVGGLILVPLALASAQTTSATIDFEGLTAGDTVSTVAEGAGMTGASPSDGHILIQGSNSDPMPRSDGTVAAPGSNFAMIFDAGCPGGCSGEDPDLEQPSNKPPLGKVLIISEDLDSNDPDDEADGGVLTFDFRQFGTGIVTIRSLDALDVGGELLGRAPSSIEFRDENGQTRTRSLPSSGGANESETIIFNEAGVVEMAVILGESGAIDNIVIEYDDSPTTSPPPTTTTTSPPPTTTTTTSPPPTTTTTSPPPTTTTTSPPPTTTTTSPPPTTTGTTTPTTRTGTVTVEIGACEVLPTPSGRHIVRVTAENETSAPAAATEVSVAIPPNLAYDSHAGDGDFDPTSGLWRVPVVPAGQSAELALRLAGQAPGSLITVETSGSSPVTSEVELIACQANAAIVGVVWFDADGNGSRGGTDEDPIGGLAVELLNLSGDVLESDTTDSAGTYRFQGLEAEIYRIALSPGEAGDRRITTSHPVTVVLANAGTRDLGPNIGLTDRSESGGFPPGTDPWCWIMCGGAIAGIGWFFVLPPIRRRSQTVIAIDLTQGLHAQATDITITRKNPPLAGQD